MELLESLRNLIYKLRREKREQYHRHVTAGDLLTDRWEIARDYGFGVKGHLATTMPKSLGQVTSLCHYFFAFPRERRLKEILF
jgi:hypothetical protein